MKGMPLLLVALAALMLPTHSAAAETPHARVAFISSSTTEPIYDSVCIMDVATLAYACPLAAIEGRPDIGTDNRYLSWSPDGTMIAVQREQFRGGENTGSDIAVFAANGTSMLPNGPASPVVLASDVRVQGRPMWSNDSRRVAAIGEGGIVIADINSGHIQTLDLGSYGIYDAAWSPDNSRFAVAQNDSNGIALELVDPATGAVQIVRHFEGSDISAGGINGISWSHDGRHILFTHLLPPTAPGPGGPSELWIVDANGKNAKMLYDSGIANGFTLEASFSSDSQSIAFDGYTGDIQNVFLSNLGGSDVHQLTHSTTGAFGPRFDGDGRALYWDLDTTTTNMITFSRDDPEHGTVKTLLAASEYEWAPAPGPLPRGAVTPTATPQPIATGQPLPVMPATPIGNTIARPLTPTPTSLQGPNVGSGPSGGHDRSWYGWLGLVGAGALIGGLVVRRTVLRGR